MKHVKKLAWLTLPAGPILILALAAVVSAFSNQWSTHFNGGNGEFGQWDPYKIGACGGQSHSVSNSQVHMTAAPGTDCFGAYYRDNNGRPGTFPTDQDVRVMWQWRYPQFGKYGSQAGQVTSAYGVVQYYGMSGVDTKQVGGDTRDAHVLTDGEWGRNTVDNPLWQSGDNDHNWHTSTFDFICDGRELTWWIDYQQIKRITNGTPRGAGDPYRPYQFWFGNLLTDVPSAGDWTHHDLEYVYVFAVERPVMNTPTAGSSGVQVVTWNPVPNTPQPDGATWTIQYQVQACSDPNCTSVIKSSDFQAGTSYTFTGLPLQQTYHYRTRARWVGTPELITCWGNTVSALMAGEPDITLSKSAPAQATVGDTVHYSLILRSTGEVPANGLVVRDPVPQYIINPANISSGGTLQGNEIVWNLGTVPNGESRSLTWEGTVDPNTPTSVTQIRNVATARDNAGHTAQAEATTAVLKPVLELEKTATPLAWPGGTIAFTITVRSSGNSALRQVVVRDPVPNYVTRPTRISNGGSLQGNEIVWNLPDIGPGQAVILTWQGTVASDIPRTETELINHVTGTAAGGIRKEAEARTRVGFPVIGVGKTGPTEAAPGETIDYIVVVHNTGTAPAIDVVVRDPVPPYILNPTNISQGGSLESGEIIWRIGSIEPGESVTVGWQGTVDPDIPITQNSLVNTATACDTTGSCDTAVVSTRVLKPAVSLTKNATSHVYPHGLVEYELIVTNSGETVLKEIVVRDPLPEYVLNPQDISADGIADASPFEGKIEVVWRLPNLAPGEVIILTWRGTVAPHTPDQVFAIRNVAAVTTKHAGAEAEASSYVLHPRLLLRKSATVMAGPDDSILYTLTVENHSWAPAYGVEIHDPLPQYIINQRNATEGGEVRAEEVLWTFGVMQPGESRTLMWEGTVDPNVPATVTKIANTAVAFDGMGHRAEAEAVTNLPGQLVYTYKSASYIVWPGGEIEYAITVQNFNQATLQGVVVRDPLQAGVLYPRDISHNGVFEGNMEVVWHIDQIAPGEAVVLTWRGTVDPSLARTQDVLWNEASLTSSGGLTATARAKSYVDFPRINVYKVATPQAGPGEVISYTVMVENPTNVPALDVAVRDPIPTYVTNPSAISDGGLIETIPAEQVVWHLDGLNAGERRLLSWEGTLDLSIPAARGQITNTVYAGDLTGLAVQATSSTVLLRPGLSLAKSAPAEVIPGQEVGYSLTVSNTGQMKLRQVTVVDEVPPHILTPTNISDNGVLAGNRLAWSLGDLLPGAQVTLTWQGILDKAVPFTVSRIRNVATASAWPGLEAVAVAESQVVQPDLLVVKHAPAGVRPGEIADYRIDIVNQGRTTAYQLQLTDPITSYVSPFKINDGGYEMPGGYITWGELGDLAPGQSRSFSWQARVDPDIPHEVTAIRNVARLQGLGGLAIEAEAVSPVLESGLLLTKEAISATHAGGEISYTLHLVNNGPGLARQVEVHDPLPGFVTYLPGSANTYGQWDEAQQEVVWRFDQLQPGQAVDLTWRGQVDLDIPPGVQAIVNEARATSIDEPQPVTAAATTVILEPVLEAEQLCAPFAQAGDHITYHLRLQNSGGGSLPGVVVRETIPLGLAYVPGSAVPDDQADGNRIMWDLGTLAAGAAVDLRFDLQLDPGYSQAEITNTLDFSSGGRIVGQSECLTRITTPALSITKTAPARAVVNDVIEYSIVVSNSGQVVAHNTVLTDILFPGVDYVPGTASNGGEVSGSTLVWRLGDLPVGQSATRTFKAQVYVPLGFEGYDQNGDARLYNQAIVAADRAAPVKGDWIVLVPRPVLTLTRTALTQSKTGQFAAYASTMAGAGPTVVMAKVELGSEANQEAALSAQSQHAVPAIQVVPGDIITYTLVGGNTGPGVARQAVLKEWVPTGLLVLEDSISDDGFYNSDEHAVIWPLGDLAEGQQVRRIYAALVPHGVRPDLFEVEDNLAFISSPDTATVYANATTEMTGTFELTGLKTATGYVEKGGRIDYAIKVQNTSPNMLDYIVIRDPLPDYTSYIEDSAALPPAFEDGGRTLVWNLGALAAGEIKEVRFSVRVAASLPDVIGRILNKATISFTGGNSFEVQATTMLPTPEIKATATAKPPSSNNNAPAGPAPTATPVPGRPPVVQLPAPPTPVPPAGPTPLPAPGLVKSVAPGVVKAGENSSVTWRLSFSNPTPLTIGGLVIRDVLPDGVAYLSSSTSRGAIEVNQMPLFQPPDGITWTVEPGTQATPDPMLVPPPPVAQSLMASPEVTQAVPLTQALGLGQTVELSATNPATTTISQAQPPTPAWTELVIHAGDVPAGGRVDVIINTMIISPTRGQTYRNQASYSGLNLDPGLSNEVSVTVNAPMAILPVTGGWLDPRTPEGKITWGSVLVLAVLGAGGWQRRRMRRLGAEDGGEKGS